MTRKNENRVVWPSQVIIKGRTESVRTSLLSWTQTAYWSGKPIHHFALEGYITNESGEYSDQQAIKLVEATFLTKLFWLFIDLSFNFNIILGKDKATQSLQIHKKIT